MGNAELGALEGHLAGFQPGKIENVVDQVQQVLGGVPGDLHELALLRRHFRGHEDVQGTDHAIERRADLVADGGGEIRLELGELERIVPGGTQFPLPILQYAHHAVEGRRHLPDVLGPGWHSAGIAGPLGRLHGRRQLLQRPGQASGEPAQDVKDQERDEEGNREVDRKHFGPHPLEGRLALDHAHVAENLLPRLEQIEGRIRGTPGADRRHEAPGVLRLRLQVGTLHQLHGLLGVGRRRHVVAPPGQQQTAVGLADLHGQHIRESQGRVHGLGGIFRGLVDQRQLALPRQVLGDVPPLLQQVAPDLPASLPGGGQGGHQGQAEHGHRHHGTQLPAEGCLAEPPPEVAHGSGNTMSKACCCR